LDAKFYTTSKHVPLVLLVFTSQQTKKNSATPR